MQNPTNTPNAAGTLASVKTTFGPSSRYAVYAVHTRFDAVQWFVSDAETVEDFGNGVELPAVIRQEDTFEAAVAGLGVALVAAGV